VTLIKSISGIRGTIGGRPGENLTPDDIVKFTSAFGFWLQQKNPGRRISVVTGRDSRTSGPVVSCLVNNTLVAMGIDVIDTGLATTPTVEVAVTGSGSAGGIIITASHNPAEWNALKLLNNRGEFLSSSEGEELLSLASSGIISYAIHKDQGNIFTDLSWSERHIDMILSLDAVNRDAVARRNFRIVADCINSVGALVIPPLLYKMGVSDVILINATPDGNFAHNPEPLPENLSEISEKVVTEKADLGIVVDPDVDRLAIICEDGTMFGEEYTLVAVADYILSKNPGNTVSNMSSTRALKVVAEKYGGRHFTSPVGEINVVEEMKRRNAVIGGEGNGGVIYPEAHYGRDALAGIALFLSLLAGKGTGCRELRKSYPEFFISKNKIQIEKSIDFDKLSEIARREFINAVTDRRDGLLIEGSDWWIHARSSNTEPIIRVYAEAATSEKAELLSRRMIQIVKNI